MNSPVVINGKEVERLIYKDQPVITMRMVDDLHERPTNTARRNFHDNKKHFIEGEDYFVVSYDEWSTLTAIRNSSRGPGNGPILNVRNSYDQNGGHRGSMTFLTQTGYLMLVKSFTDDLAWKIQRQLVNRYFEPKAMGYRYDERQGFLPRPGLSMEAIADLCRIADKTLHGKAALRALNFFGGMPVDDLIEEIESQYPERSTDAATIVQYLQALVDGTDGSKFSIEKGTTPEGHPYLQAETTPLFNAFTFLQRKERLPKIADTLTSFAAILWREVIGIGELGWKAIYEFKSTGGRRFHRFVCLSVSVS